MLPGFPVLLEREKQRRGVCGDGEHETLSAEVKFVSGIHS